MKKPMFAKSFFRILFTVLVVFSGRLAYSFQSGIAQTIKNANAPINDEKRVDSVLYLPDDIVLVKARYQGGFFWTETRKDKVGRFKCSRCHNNKAVNISQAAEMVHGNVVLVHGFQEKQLSCFTCHQKDARDFLVDEKGLNVDMDHSYQMCGQCHFRQKKDWVGGAHGKRVSNWAGKRVVKNCTSCHNPHSPLFEKRWPKTYSRPLRK